MRGDSDRLIASFHKWLATIAASSVVTCSNLHPDFDDSILENSADAARHLPAGDPFCIR
jgi:hypothetical protein